MKQQNRKICLHKLAAHNMLQVLLPLDQETRCSLLKEMNASDQLLQRIEQLCFLESTMKRKDFFSETKRRCEEDPNKEKHSVFYLWLHHAIETAQSVKRSREAWMKEIETPKHVEA